MKKCTLKARAAKPRDAAPLPPLEDPNRPLTQAERVKAFRTATHSFASWYADDIAAGMTDAALQAALQSGIGIWGGCSGPGEMDVSYAGAGLRIWAGWTFQNTTKDRPLFSGAATVAMAREVYKILDPSARQMALL